MGFFKIYKPKYMHLVNKISAFMLSHSVVSNSVSLWTMRFSRQESQSGLPFPLSGDLPDSGIKPASPALEGRFFTIEPPEKPKIRLVGSTFFSCLKLHLLHTVLIFQPHGVSNNLLDNPFPLPSTSLASDIIFAGWHVLQHLSPPQLS